MEKTCAECGRTLKLKEFKYNQDLKIYTDVCKCCMDEKYWKYKKDYSKNAAVATIRNKWKQLCPQMTPAEVDQQLFNLKQIYLNYKGELKDEG